MSAALHQTERVVTFRVPGKPQEDESRPTLKDSSDIERARAMIQALCPGTPWMKFIVIEGPPKSKARPRLGKRGSVYSPSKPNEEALGWELKTIFKQRIEEGNLAVGCVFYRPNRQRIDVDNLLKLVMDAATGIVWKDDSQVTAQLGILEMDKERPRTVIVFGEHQSSLQRVPITRTCKACGSSFVVDCEVRTQRYCSAKCKASVIKQKKVHPGQGKGRKRQPPATCTDCGKVVSKRSYIRCRDCWKAARSKGVS